MTSLRISGWVRGVLLTSATLALAACGTANPRLLSVDYPVRSTPAPSSRSLPAPPPSQDNRTAGRYKVGSPYQVNGRWYTPAEDPRYNEVGVASWYGDAFNGAPTANGEVFDMYLISAAHKTLPLPSIVEVTNLDNGRSIQVRVNDRGPFVDGRIIDLSRAAADELGVLQAGLARVRVRYVGRAPLDPRQDTSMIPTSSRRASR